MEVSPKFPFLGPTCGSLFSPNQMVIRIFRNHILCVDRIVDKSLSRQFYSTIVPGGFSRLRHTRLALEALKGKEGRQKGEIASCADTKGLHVYSYFTPIYLVNGHPASNWWLQAHPPFFCILAACSTDPRTPCTCTPTICGLGALPCVASQPYLGQ